MLPRRPYLPVPGEPSAMAAEAQHSSRELNSDYEGENLAG